MFRITAAFQVVTPLFMSGADQSKFELRGASFKGALHFWWRALAYERFHGNLQEIHKEESKIFGSADTGRGVFSIRISKPTPEKILNNNESFNGASGNVDGSGASYLGYGLMKPNAILNRPCLLAPSLFTVDLNFRDKIDESVVSALKIMGLLGGLGSRSRRGYGSLTLEKVEGDITWVAPDNFGSYKSEIASLLGTLLHGRPEYSAFTAASRITMLNSGNDALKLLDQIGSRMQMYRSWQKEKNFREDHDLVRDFVHGNPTTEHPKRIVFGLPHNYFFSSLSGGKADVVPEFQTRRASPLMIHIHKFGINNFAGLVCILPADFLPSGEQINIKNIVKSEMVPQNADFKFLHDFIDGFEGLYGAKDLSSPYFPKKAEIYP